MITIKNLSMHFGSTVAIDNISFHIPHRGIIGILGPNGAGKTTLLRILTTYLCPTSGEVIINSYNTVTDPIPIREMIGYLAETPPLYMDMLVCDYLSFIADIRNLSKEIKRQRINWILDVCKINTVYKKTIIELSRGYRQRVGLAQALIHDPDIIILDEPTSGLDPLQTIEIRNLLKGLAKDKTIIFSSHILQEVTAVSDRVIIINNGKILTDGSMAQLEIEAMKTKRTILEVRAKIEEVSMLLDKIDGIIGFQHNETEYDGFVTFNIQSDRNKTIYEDINSLVKRKGWIVKSFHEQPLDFEEVFLFFMKESKKQRKQRQYNS